MKRSGRLSLVEAGQEAKRLHKTRCGIPLVELANDEYSIDDNEVTCQACLDLNRPPRHDTGPESQ